MALLGIPVPSKTEAGVHSLGGLRVITFNVVKESVRLRQRPNQFKWKIIPTTKTKQIKNITRQPLAGIMITITIVNTGYYFSWSFLHLLVSKCQWDVLFCFSWLREQIKLLFDRRRDLIITEANFDFTFQWLLIMFKWNKIKIKHRLQDLALTMMFHT